MNHSGTNGLVLLNKQPGISSFRSLGDIKNRLKTQKVGHTGTLDPFAGGLLLVLVGKYTRLAPLFSGLEKEYEACIEFGRRTDTLDPEGTVVEEGSVPGPAVVETAVSGFHGTIEQVPPLFSAVHYKGKRAYKRIREGERFELPSRKVSIDEIDILSYVPPFLTVRVRCSGGTYIRALARDIGEAAGTCAFVPALKRTGIGNFRLADAVIPSDFNPSTDVRGYGYFLPLIDTIKSIRIKDSCAAKVRNGSKIHDDFFEEPPREEGCYALCGKGDLHAIVEKKGNDCKYILVVGGSLT
ncbi:MAG: tRNA pseudouridine(55) synthase TruB [Spirochaetales bacterium]|nr:tRNA pseudouridine(55) synthase TruB [Spirochaetales bacterium]